MKKILTIALLVAVFFSITTSCEKLSHEPLVESPRANVSPLNTSSSNLEAKGSSESSSDVLRVGNESVMYSVASTSYTSSPIIGNWTNPSSGTLRLSCATFNAGLRSKIVSLNGNKVVVEIQRADGKPFGQGGTAYSKTTDPCGTVAGTSSWTRTDYYFIQVSFDLNFSSGYVAFYPTIKLNSGERLYSNPVGFTAKSFTPSDACSRLVNEECVIYARCRNSKLPYGLFTYDQKIAIINAYSPASGYTAIIKVGSGPKGNNVGHVAHIEQVAGSIIYLAETNWVKGIVNRRSGTASQLNIVGYRTN